ncbi:MAG: hypothetical protein IJP90_01395 [Treponema sp.]|nr:hypothetical protein [Treponema sp.]MBR0098351.1 hypothetical protein [Treponema sp.]
MSTSLEKDLHSVYIDGEMPESFVSQYESIVQADSGEKSRLEKMQKLHALLQEDSNKKSVSDQFIEESFARLQTKMRYTKNVEFAGEPKSFVTPFIKYASSFAAAAAVFAVVFIPLHYNSLSKAKETAVAAISIMKEKSIEPIAKKDVVIDGNINKEDLPKMLAVKSEPKKAESVQKQAAPAPASESTAIAKADSPASESTETLSVEQKTIYATNLASSYGASTSFGTRQSQNAPSIGRRFRERLTAVDPFIPDFPSSSIKFSVPNFHEIGNNMEIMDLPNETENETEQQ